MSKLTHVKTLIAALPATPLRPAGTPQLSNALESIIGRASKRAAGGADDGAAQERVWEGMSGSLERLQNGAAGRAYPLSDRTLRPAHDPMYYTRIREGVHLSAQGKGRSWWKSFFQLKGDA